MRSQLSATLTTEFHGVPGFTHGEMKDRKVQRRKAVVQPAEKHPYACSLQCWTEHHQKCCFCELLFYPVGLKMEKDCLLGITHI